MDHMEYETPEHRRRIRSEYRNLIDQTEKNRQDLIRPDDQGLNKALDTADELFDKVKGTREAVLDSHFLVLASQLGAQQAQQLQTDFQTFDSHLFVEKLITFMCGRRIVEEDQSQGSDEDDDAERHDRIQRLDWGKLGRHVSHSFSRTPTIDFMLGPLEVKAPTKNPKKPNNPALKPSANSKITPAQIDRVETREEATTKEVERIHNVLLELTSPDDDDDAEFNPISLYEFAVNPNSFGQTVENFFHISFLTQKGTAEIKLDQDGLPVIVPCNPYQESDRGNTVSKKQNLISLSMSEWRDIVRAFNIEAPLIPTRPPAVLVDNRNPSPSSDDVDMEDEEGQR